MARSNGPLTPPGAGRTPRPDPQSWAQGTPPRAGAARSPASAYEQQQPQAPQASFTPQSAGAAYQEAAYGAHASTPQFASSPQADPRTAPPARQPSSSAFDTLVSQSAPQQAHRQQSYAPQTSYPNQQAYPSLTQPAHNGHGGDYVATHDQAAYAQWSAPQGATTDARGFDYGSFGAATGPNGQSANGYAETQGYRNQPNFDAGHNGQQGYAGWNHGDGFGHEPSLEGGYEQHGYGQDGAGTLDQSYADDEFEETPRKRGKLPLIAAAVVGALLCGGGLAYGYKTFLGPVPGGDTPLIRTSSIPSKVKPDDPGGRRFDHTNQEIMGGSGKVMGGPLGDGAEGQGTAEGARKVQTVEVRPDGSVVPSSDASSGAPPSTASASAMEFPSAGDTGRSAEPPQVIAKAEPAPEPSAPPPAAREDVSEEPPPPASEPKKVATKKVAAAAATAPTGPAPTGAGWVAVLASVPVSSSSQMDSLKQFADMQQKYGDVLSDKTPSVQEANLGEKGRYHRLVVGPPASRDSASSICGSLKSAGFNGCWVMQY
jgi:hypothetical protein